MSDLTYTDADAPSDEIAPPREVPWSLDAEQSALGSMMLSRDALEDVMSVVQPDHFYQPKHELIARAIGALVSRNDPVDVLTVGDELQKAGHLTRVGGAAYLHQLTSVPLTTVNAGHHAQIVNEHARRRVLLEVGMQITTKAYASEGTVDELEDAARRALDAATSRAGKSVRRVGEQMDAILNSLDEKPKFHPTPWGPIDRLIGGFAPGSLVVVAARPGQGKTIALLQSAVKLARTGLVAFCSLEMTEQELGVRLLSHLGEVPMQSLRNHTLSEMEWKRIAEAARSARSAPIFINDAGQQTLATIRQHARAVARRGQLTGICVDYLQLVQGEGSDRRVIVDAISRGLKQLAKDFNVPVLAAAQLNRPQQSRGGPVEPTLASLREAGGIEQDADVVILLHRDAEKHPKDIKFIVAKNRHGELGTVKLAWQAHFARFVEKAWSPLDALGDSD